MAIGIRKPVRGAYVGSLFPCYSTPFLCNSSPGIDMSAEVSETVHGYPEAVAVVHLLVRLEILSPQVKSGPQRGSRLRLRPQAALWIGETNDSEPLTTHRKESGDIETRTLPRITMAGAY